MKRVSSLTICLPVVLLMALSGDVSAGWKDIVNSVAGRVVTPAAPPAGQVAPALGNVGQVLQNGQQAISTGGLVQSGSLPDLLMKKTGVNQMQAQGGAGALFQLAKSKMQSDAFSKLEQSVPGMQGMLGAVPAVQNPTALGGLAGKLSSVTGGAGGSAGSLVSLVSAFQQQGMSPQMVQQFIPIVVDYVKNSGGGALASTLSSALAGL